MPRLTKGISRDVNLPTARRPVLPEERIADQYWHKRNERYLFSLALSRASDVWFYRDQNGESRFIKTPEEF